MKANNEFCIAFLNGSGWMKNHDKKIRDDAIDEFAKTYDKVEIYGCELCEHLNDDIKCWHCVAEKLKEQKQTCFDCKNHFMSDCYLECHKHERINNNSICDDFEQLKENNK